MLLQVLSLLTCQLAIVLMLVVGLQTYLTSGVVESSEL